ncbi:DoxX family protein [Phytoactinopolyspora limicola]|uniref:DoxX family protein n=1 Tax=Phytoactinopolyspora limicola TaxID=2715536 RepID=UPI00140BFFD0|nr:DoxX family protein [Phytoactinopolyspora limicola]
MSAHEWRHRLATAGYWLLATSFFLGFVTKFWPGPTFFGPAYSEKFAEWGYPMWFRFVVGGIEGVCAVLLVIPRRRSRFLGAVALVLLLVGANTTHIIAGSEVSDRVFAPTLLLVSAAIALANWPADWRDLLRPERRSPTNAAPMGVGSGHPS